MIKIAKHLKWIEQRGLPKGAPPFFVIIPSPAFSAYSATVQHSQIVGRIANTWTVEKTYLGTGRFC
jgi:hypothetical protein